MPVRNAIGGEPHLHLYPDHAISHALERMGATGVDALPVVSRADRGELRGIVTLASVLEAYGVGGGLEARKS